ncbi:MAG: type II toxin-antitoxin system death-on-curing family toxin [Lewinellaceae bacterium]|nr:type II toxin-antitoxin system death-on-curing family toxin [Saprospiraceae bacterium]MCB9343386.1 type II toxin-antitoxin system death-on-curing family toxin [Lewinellaceae bacterium]
MNFTLSEVLAIHRLLIEEFGGSFGVRDQKGLEAALSRPFQSFEGKELYPSIEEKASAILESIVVNHPFIDGNKRVGYVLMRIVLLENGFDISASQEEKYNLVMSVAKGQMKAREIIQWIRENLIRNS